MKLTILNVAYPLAPVGPDAVGGAEQIVWQIDRALTQAGHRSLVIACDGSSVHGHLIPGARCGSNFSEGAVLAARARHRAALSAALSDFSVDVIHLHGLDFHSYLPPMGWPTLVTLHLPPGWYARESFESARPDLLFQCVSLAQQKACPPGLNLLPVVENGVQTERFHPSPRKRNFALALGRVCPEKGFHLALDAASRAEVPLLIGGCVFPYSFHVDYFEREIVPRLRSVHRFLGPLELDRKRRFLANARCLLAPSLAPETSSLVAMEALSSGTPVVAFRAGALAEIVEHGRTGFLVDDERCMAEAIHAISQIRPEDCRAAACQRFSALRMTNRYLQVYGELAGQSRTQFDLRLSRVEEQNCLLERAT